MMKRIVLLLMVLCLVSNCSKNKQSDISLFYSSQLQDSLFVFLNELNTYGEDITTYVVLYEDDGEAFVSMTGAKGYFVWPLIDSTIRELCRGVYYDVPICVFSDPKYDSLINVGSLSKWEKKPQPKESGFKEYASLDLQKIIPL